LGNVEEGYLSGDFEGQVSYQGMHRIRLWNWVSLYVEEPVGGVIRFLGTLRDS